MLRRRPLVAVALAALLLSVSTATAAPVSSGKCLKRTVSETKRFADGTHKALATCNELVAKGKDCAVAAREAQITRLVGAFRKKLQKSCSAEMFAARGFPGACPDLTGGGFSVDDLASCLGTTGRVLIDVAAAAAYPKLDIQQGKALRCQRTIGRASVSFMQRDLRARLGCLEATSAANCLADTLPVEGQGQDALELAGATMRQQLGRACAAADLSALGFPGSCAAMGGAGSFAVDELVTCLTRVHDAQARAVAALVFPAAVLPATPTGTPTPGPTPTNAGTATAAITATPYGTGSPLVLATPTGTQQSTPEATATVTATIQPTPTVVASTTSTPIATSVPTLTVVNSTQTATPAPVPTATPTDGLPPDPGEAGKATLAGIDSDGDGVRDDIQRYIAFTYPDSARARMALTDFAKGMQAALMGADDRAAAIAATDRLDSAQDCLWYLYEDTSDAMWGELRAQYLNTKDRSRAYTDYDRMLNATFFALVPSDQLKTRCSFNPDELPN